MKEMLNYQQRLNDVIDPEWRINRHFYLLQVIVDSSKVIEHHGYSGVKNKPLNIPQVQQVVVNILHFYLSEIARANLESPESVLVAGWLEDIDSFKFDGSYYHLSRLGLVDKFEMLIGLAVSRRVSWPLFRSIAVDAEFSFIELYRRVVDYLVVKSTGEIQPIHCHKIMMRLDG